MNDQDRLRCAEAVAQWQTTIDHAIATGETELLDLLEREQRAILSVVLAYDKQLFYPGHTDLAEGPALARRYVTEHQQELEVLNQE